MKRLLCSVLLAGAGLTAQTPKSVQATLIALKDAGAPRKALSDQLINQMMGVAKNDFYRPARTTVQRFSEDFTNALLGKDVTSVRAKVIRDGDSWRPERKGIYFPSGKHAARNTYQLRDRRSDGPDDRRAVYRYRPGSPRSGRYFDNRQTSNAAQVESVLRPGVQ
jgi:hypothetical protein